MNQFTFFEYYLSHKFSEKQCFKTKVTNISDALSQIKIYIERANKVIKEVDSTQKFSFNLNNAIHMSLDDLIPLLEHYRSLSPQPIYIDFEYIDDYGSESEHRVEIGMNPILKNYLEQEKDRFIHKTKEKIITCFQQIELEMLQNPQWEHWQDRIKETKDMFKEFKASTKKKNSLKPK
jgi:hypothetical protein